ncbi:hypothetical protein OG780_28745 [Streptomyces sp. NBC_00386]|uniref:hypothetical protein n=1 Tax=Streptomyces sp. NBC_00386 TaxID=2975734 RepID=UPI002E1F314A
MSVSSVLIVSPAAGVWAQTVQLRSRSCIRPWPVASVESRAWMPSPCAASWAVWSSMPTKSPTVTLAAPPPEPDDPSWTDDEDEEPDDESSSPLISALHPPTTRSATSRMPQPT